MTDIDLKDVKLNLKDGDLSLLICSWNVGNKAPTSSLNPWVPSDGSYDIVVIGVQEATYSKDVASDKFESSIDEEAEENSSGDEDNKFIEGEVSTVDVNSSNTEFNININERGEGNNKLGKIGKKHSKLFGVKNSFKFFHRVVETLGESYICIQDMVLLQMGLIICVKKEIRDKITNIESGKEATGLAGVYGNKGGLVIKFEIDDISLAFCSTHLAAHRGEKFRENRHGNIREILNGALIGNKKLDFTSQFTHVFWFGDMNYRSDINFSMISQGKNNPDIEQSEMFQQVTKLIESEKYNEVYDLDELHHCINNEVILSGFQEGKMNFRPTFKVERKPGMHYKTNRVPSYCDRIFWKSMPAHKNELQLSHFNSFEDVWTSDHKPIQAGFVLSRPATPVKLHPETSNMKPVINFTSMKATGIKAADLNGKSDPYLAFYSYPNNLFQTDKSGVPRSKHLRSTLNPVFSDDFIPSLIVNIKSKKELRACHLIVAVVDYDLGNEDDLLGTVIISMEEIMQNTMDGKYVFDKSILSGSSKHGTLSGCISVAWPDSEAYETVKANTDVHSNKCCVLM